MNMNNSNTNGISAWEIEAHLDGFTDKRVAAYLKKNPAAVAFAEPDEVETSLGEMLFRSECPDSFDLLNYQWGMLDGDEAVVMSAHVAACPHCSAESQSLAEPVLEAVSKPARPSIWSRVNETVEAIRTLVARPLTLGEMSLAPVRSDSAEQFGTQIYRVDQLGWDIVIEHEANPYFDTVTLQGQLLADTLLDGLLLQISLVDDDTIVSTIEIDEWGVFSFEAVSKQAYTLCIHSNGVEICLPGVSFH